MSIVEVTIWTITAFVFSVILISILYVNNIVTAEMDSVFNNPTVTTWFNSMNSVWVWLDYALIFSYLSFVAGSLVLGYFINTHPVFYVPYMVGMFFVTFLSWIIREVYLEFIASFSGFSTLYNSFPMTQFMMNNLPFFVLLAGFFIATVQYSKADRNILANY